MSYILEALKKVEQERELEQVPGLHSRHDLPQRRPLRHWPWVLAVALLLSVSLMAVLWWQGGTGPGEKTQTAQRSTEPVVEGAPSPDAGPPPLASQTKPVPQSRAAASSAPETPLLRQADTGAPFKDPDGANATAIASAPPPPEIPRRPLRPLPLADPPPEPKPASATAEPAQAGKPAVPAPSLPVASVMPTEIVELRAPAVPTQPQDEPAWKRLPLWPLVPVQIARQVNGRLVLNAHFYSERPEDRFVLLNMRKYTAGEQTSEGPDVEEITREGVILAVPEGRFRLKSQ